MKVSQACSNKSLVASSIVKINVFPLFNANLSSISLMNKTILVTAKYLKIALYLETCKYMHGLSQV